MEACQIELTKGKIARVSPEDWEQISKWKWSAITDWNGGTYAVRYAKTSDSRPRTTYMHREIMGAATGYEVDHRDGNGLNNCRENLRIATRSENMRNRGIPRNNTSGFTGVSWRKQKSKWEAYIKLDGKIHHLGYFPSAIEAHRARTVAAAKLHGEFAKIA